VPARLIPAVSFGWEKLPEVRPVLPAPIVRGAPHRRSGIGWSSTRRSRLDHSSSRNQKCRRFALTRLSRAALRQQSRHQRCAKGSVLVGRRRPPCRPASFFLRARPAYCRRSEKQSPSICRTSRRIRGRYRQRRTAGINKGVCRLEWTASAASRCQLMSPGCARRASVRPSMPVILVNQRLRCDRTDAPRRYRGRRAPRREPCCDRRCRNWTVCSRAMRDSVTRSFALIAAAEPCMPRGLRRRGGAGRLRAAG